MHRELIRLAASYVSRQTCAKDRSAAPDPYVCHQKLENDRPKGRWTRSLERSETVASHEVGHLGEIVRESEALRDRCGD
jgi:hypothetical protein